MKLFIGMIFICLWILLFTSCNEDCKPPVVEYCVIRSADLYCINKNLEEDEQRYTKSFWDAKKYIAVSPDNYERLRKAWDDLCKRLNECDKFQEY